MLQFRKSVAAMIAAACATLASPVAAADYPSETVRLVVPYPAGGGADFIARLIGDALSTRIGQPVIVENRGGGNTIIATQMVAEAPADGYTLLLASSAFATNPALYEDLPYDSETDFRPVAMLGRVPMIVMTHHDSGIHSLGELIEQAKAEPGALTFASYGSGSSSHLGGELFKMMADIDMLHVPYKGSAAALTDLLAGRVDVFFSSMSAAQPHLEGGTLDALAVTSAERFSAAQDVPTIAESGVADYEAVGWNIIIAPADVPDEIVTLLNAEINEALTSPEVSAALDKRGYGVSPMSPDELSEMISADIQKWKYVVETSGARID